MAKDKQGDSKKDNTSIGTIIKKGISSMLNGLGLRLFTKDEFQTVAHRIRQSGGNDYMKDTLKKGYYTFSMMDWEDNQNFRSSIDYLTVLTTEHGIKVPIYPLKYWDCYQIFRNSDVLRIAIQTLTREIFRHGFSIVKKFEWKCDNCNKEYAIDTDGICDECGSKMRRPSEQEKQILRDLITNSVNLNLQTLENLMIELERDIDIWDNVFMLIVKHYEIDMDNKKIISETPVEIIRLSPAYTGKLMDRTGRLGYGDTGNKQYMCVIHRDKVYEDKTECPRCGLKLRQVGYAGNLAIMGTLTTMDTNPIYYTIDEICYANRYAPSMIYGISPIFSLWAKLLSLIYQDRFVQTYYMRQRPPKGLLFVRTRNVTGLQKQWQNAMDRLKYNPYDLYPIAYETASDKEGGVQWIPLTIKLDEMEWIETREEFRKIVYATYGITPIYGGDVTSPQTGVTNEGLEMAVTNRAVEAAQRTYNEEILPFILNAFNIKDYNLMLTKPEKRDLLSNLQIEQMKINIAMGMKQLGFKIKLQEDVDWENKGLKFIFSGESALSSQENDELVTSATSTETSNISELKPQHIEGEPAHLHPEQQTIEGQPDYFHRESDIDKDNKDNKESDSKYVKNCEFYKMLEEQVLFSQCIIKGLVESGRFQKGNILNKQSWTEIIQYALKNIYELVFAKLTKVESDLVKREIFEGFKEETSIDSLKSRVRKKIPSIEDKLSDNEIENIVRTEMIALENKSKELGYLEEEAETDRHFDYEWQTAKDDRVCEACKELESETSRGLKLEDLKIKIKQIRKKYYPKLIDRDFIVHPQDRCTWIRKI